MGQLLGLAERGGRRERRRGASSTQRSRPSARSPAPRPHWSSRRPGPPTTAAAARSPARAGQRAARRGRRRACRPGPALSTAPVPRAGASRASATSRRSASAGPPRHPAARLAAGRRHGRPRARARPRPRHAALTRAVVRGEPRRPRRPRRQRPAPGQHGRLRLAHPHRHQPVVRPAVPHLRPRAAVVQRVVRALPVAGAPRRPGADPGTAPAGLRHRRALAGDRAHRPARRRGAAPADQRRGRDGPRLGPGAHARHLHRRHRPGARRRGEVQIAARFQSLVESAPDAILVLDGEQQVIELQPAGARDARGRPARARHPRGAAHLADHAEPRRRGARPRRTRAGARRDHRDRVNPEDDVARLVRGALPARRQAPTGQRGARVAARRGPPASPSGARDQRQRGAGTGGRGVRPRPGPDADGPGLPRPDPVRGAGDDGRPAGAARRRGAAAR